MPQVPKADSNEGGEAKEDGEVGGEDEEEAEGGGEGDGGTEEEEAKKNQPHFSQPIIFHLLRTFRLRINLQILPFKIHLLDSWLGKETFLGDDLACWLSEECPGKGWKAVFKRAEKMGASDGAAGVDMTPRFLIRCPTYLPTCICGLRGSGVQLSQAPVIMLTPIICPLSPCWVAA